MEGRPSREKRTCDLCGKPASLFDFSSGWLVGVRCCQGRTPGDVKSDLEEDALKPSSTLPLGADNAMSPLSLPVKEDKDDQKAERAETAPKKEDEFSAHRGAHIAPPRSAPLATTAAVLPPAPLAPAPLAVIKAPPAVQFRVLQAGSPLIARMVQLFSTSIPNVEAAKLLRDPKYATLAMLRAPPATAPTPASALPSGADDGAAAAAGAAHADADAEEQTLLIAGGVSFKEWHDTLADGTPIAFAEVAVFAVDSSLRGLGLGSHLMARLQQHAHERGLPTLFACVGGAPPVASGGRVRAALSAVCRLVCSVPRHPACRRGGASSVARRRADTRRPGLG